MRGRRVRVPARAPTSPSCTAARNPWSAPPFWLRCLPMPPCTGAPLHATAYGVAGTGAFSPSSSTTSSSMQTISSTTSRSPSPPGWEDGEGEAFFAGGAGYPALGFTVHRWFVLNILFLFSAAMTPPSLVQLRRHRNVLSNGTLSSVCVYYCREIHKNLGSASGLHATAV